MNSNDELCQELQSELLKQINQCKTTYTNLVMMTNGIDSELKECNEHYVTCFIQYELLEFSNDGVNTRTNDIMKRFGNRFNAGSAMSTSNDWIGDYKYNFGDVIFDEKYNTKAIVVNETRVYVHLWYYSIDSVSSVLKNRKKVDCKLKLVKRCDMSF